MQKLIVIDVCMRDEDSRTKRILKPIVAELGKRYEIETITLDGEDYQSVGRSLPNVSAALCRLRLWCRLRRLLQPTES